MRVLFLIVLLLCVDVVSATEETKTKLEAMLGVEMAARLGVGKLTLVEQNAWAALLNRLTGNRSLETAATAYMKAEGWDVVTYHGDVRRGLKTFSVFSFGKIIEETYAVEGPVLFSLTPGQCFAKIALLGDGLDSVLDARGREHRFILDRWIKLD